MLAQMLVAPAVALDVQPPMPLGSSDVPGNSQNRACPLKTSPNKAAMPFQRDSSTSSCSSWCSLLSCRRRWVLSGLYGEGVWFVSGFLKMYGASPFRVFNTRTPRVGLWGSTRIPHRNFSPPAKHPQYDDRAVLFQQSWSSASLARC